MKYQEKHINVDLVVIGAGLSGVVAAIQAARKGISVALINNRGVLGGNASAEIGVNINGANDGGQLNINAREGGICSEILLEYKYRSPSRTNPFILDGVYLDFIDREKNIQLFLNTCIDQVATEGNKITSVSGTQNTTETRWIFTSDLFADNTGDGSVGNLAGAEYMIGREAKKTFNELIAPDEKDDFVLPSTLNFTTKDVGYKVPYIAPDFAFDIEASGVLERRRIQDSHSRWYYEIGGDYDHVKDREAIIKDHKKLVFGIWDYLKNSGKFPEYDTYDFDFMSTIPGTREYRRLLGDYVLTENDIRHQTDFPDVVGHGGWNIDLHAIKGIFDEDLVNRHIHFDGIYQIPYRILYSKNIVNLFMGGRNLSVSHVAFGSVRVMATLSTLGQAVGMAASLCNKYTCTPRDIYESHIEELQQELLAADQLVLGVKNTDTKDLAKEALVSASSSGNLELISKSEMNDSLVNEISPQFRSFYKKDDYNSITLSHDLGICLPIEKRLDVFKVLLKSDQDCQLTYSVYSSDKIENYGPEKLLGTYHMKVLKSQDFVWIELPINLDIANEYIMIIMKENRDIKLQIGHSLLPTTSMFISTKNTDENVVHLSTLEMADLIWERSSDFICFETRPKQMLFEPKSVINGYNRAYGAPNMWLSKEDELNPELILNWDSVQKISQININFAADTSKRFYTECVDQIFKLIGEEYEIYGEIDNELVLLASISGNHEKLNKTYFDEIETKKILVKFLKSPTNQIGVYEIRAYGNTNK